MPAKNIEEVLQELDTIVLSAIQNGDRAGYFAALYKRVTAAVAEKIRAGYFDDNGRMEKLDVIFVNYYLEAFHQYSTKGNCTAPWHTAFEATKEWSPMIIHHLLAGMNAHIGLDLGIATATVSKGSPLHLVQNDFDKINILLTEMIEEVKQELYAMWPLSKFIVRLRMGKMENALAAFSMQVARDAAWDVAVQYSLISEEAGQGNYLATRGNSVAAFSKKFLAPAAWLQFVLFVCRIFETGTVAGKIRQLNR